MKSIYNVVTEEGKTVGTFGIYKHAEGFAESMSEKGINCEIVEEEIIEE